MTKHNCQKSDVRRLGFTLVEMMVSSLLMSILAMFVASAWQGFGRSMLDGVVRGRISQESALALESLNRDLSGSLAGNFTGEVHHGSYVGRLVVGGSELRLCFDGAPFNGSADWASPDTVIVYEVQNGQLLRSNLLTGSQFVVADLVSDLQVSNLMDGVRIEITFSLRDSSKTFYIVSRDP